MAGLNTFPSVGLTSGNQNYLKYCFALTYYGKIVFQEIFTWGFKEPHSEIKESLFKLPNYSNSRFRSDFDQSQRSKIENGCIAEFDLSLFYLLIQRLCPLDGASDKLWSKDGDAERLPAILYNIKLKRNLSTHNCQTEITEQELKLAVNELIDLFNKALLAAGKEFCISSKDVNLVTGKIVRHLESIVESSSYETMQLLKKFVEENINLPNLIRDENLKFLQNDLVTRLAEKITDLWKAEELEFMGRPCQYTVNPIFKKFKLKYVGKFWCTEWPTICGNSETNSQKGCLKHAINDFAKKAVESQLADEDEVTKWINRA